MKPQELFEILAVAEKLKCTTRHCATSSGRQESVAEHSWRIALMALLLEDEFPEADINKVIRMCLIHDLGEAFTGDIPCFEKDASEEKVEEKMYMDWVQSLPATVRETFKALLDEMGTLETEEAKIYKALDKIEAVIQHNESDISTWLPLEYDLQQNYGWDNMKFSPYMWELREKVNEWTLEKIKSGK